MVAVGAEVESRGAEEGAAAQRWRARRRGGEPGAEVESRGAPPGARLRYPALDARRLAAAPGSGPG
jgi:hypothetical protein